MNVKYKDQFELINNSLWLLIKGYIEDDKTYKSVMSQLFTIYVSCAEADDKYTDKWWNEAGRLYDIPEHHRKTDICSFAAELADAFYEVLKKEGGYEDFYNKVSAPFITEWQRLRSKDGKV